MNKIDKFAPEVIEELQYYVYRLIDTRNGNTFYVGKGKGNRLFSHVFEAEIDNDDDEVSAKIEIIRDIRSRGYEVIHVIHRWGLTEKEAREVESALIDAYPGLSNIQDGYSSDRGSTTVKEINERFAAEQFTHNIEKDKFIVIKIKQEYVNERGIYETTRASWKLNVNKVKKYPIALSVINGVVREVYKISPWHRDEKRQRWYFEGIEAEESIRQKYKDKRLPDKFTKKGLASPVLYFDKID